MLLSSITSSCRGQGLASNRVGRHHPSFVILPENKQNLGPLQGVAMFNISFLSETTKVLSVLEKYRYFNATGLQSVLLGKLVGVGSKFMATKPHTVISGSITSQHKSCNTDNFTLSYRLFPTKKLIELVPGILFEREAIQYQ